MREHDLQPRHRCRHVATTDSDHDQPIFPDRARDLPRSARSDQVDVDPEWPCELLPEFSPRLRRRRRLRRHLRLYEEHK